MPTNDTPPLTHRTDRRRFLIGAAGLFVAPLPAQDPSRFASALPPPGAALEGFPLSSPEAQGFDSGRLAGMTRFIESSGHKVFSVMIARNGHLVYEMLAANLSRDAAHYLMSVTKSLTSAIAGVALEQGLIVSEDQPVRELLPHELFGPASNLQDKAGITVRHALNMSALDVPHIVGSTDPAVRENYLRWVRAENRVRYALSQRRVQRPMSVMDYTDLTCSLVNGAIHYQSGRTVLEFANERLFSPMGFRNHEWMGQDASGIDLGGYGIRLRPIDMMKFGQLYLQRGQWNGRTLLNPAWTEKAYASQIAPRHDLRKFYSGYSNYWWHGRHRGSPRNIMASGWKGQRISVFPDTRMVVTMTGVVENAESAFYEELVSGHVLYALRGEALNDNPEAFRQLRAELARMREKPLGLDSVEPRMRPEEKNKERRKPWRS